MGGNRRLEIVDWRLGEDDWRLGEGDWWSRVGETAFDYYLVSM